jgi:FKBP-type peptidyl-prolyl cis-trans isomerase 2
LTAGDGQTVHVTGPVTFANGTATVTVTLNTADNVTLTATSGSTQGTGGSTAVSPAAATAFVVTEPGTATAGTSFTATITAVDAYGNTVTGYAGSVTLTAGDGQTVHLAATPAFVNGVATVTVTLNTADNVTLTATSGSIHGTGGSTAVSAGTATAFVVTEPGTATPGTSFTISITAKDAFGNTVTGFAGSVTLTASDGQTVHLAAAPAFVNGVASVTVTLDTTDNVTLTATSGSIHGIGSNISVGQGAATTFVVTEPATATAGTSFTITITAQDAYGNTVTGFAGSVALSDSDGQTVHVTGSETFVNGTATVTVTLNKADSVTLTATSGLIHGTGGSIAVSAAAATAFVVTEPGTATAGTSFAATITAVDAYGNTVTGYAGSVTLTAGDGQTVHLAAAPSFVSGVATVTVTLDTADSLTLTATSGAIHGSGSSTAVSPGAAAAFVVTEPATATAGTSFTITITAQDAFGNTVTGYAGSVTLTASDGQTVHLAAAPTFVNGVANVTTTLDTADSVTLTATSGSTHGSGGSTTVGAGAATAFAVSAPSGVTAGTSFTVTVTAQDAFGNTVTGFAGSVTLTASDSQTVQVAAAPSFVSGVAIVTVTLSTTDSLTLTATSGSIHGSSGSITVSSANWFSQNMPDPGLQALAKSDFTRDGSLTFSDMLGLFAEAESAGALTNAELQSLQALVTTSGAAAVNMAATVQNLTYKVVDGDPANAQFQGASLGNLQVGSSATQLQDLAIKWFLGGDHPTIDSTYISGATYALASGTLFASGGPSYKDIFQGQEGDCWLLASLGATVANDPTLIQSMFTDDGTNLDNGVQVHVWTVRFFNNGVASYLTVDNYFPASGGTFAYANYRQSLTSSTDVLWVALAEKAFAQLSASGWNMRPEQNAYASLDGGSASSGLPFITGGTENGSLADENSYIAAVQAGTLLTLASTSGNSTLGIVAAHDYVVLGYNATTQTFALLNPWGWNYSGTDPGIINLTWAQILANFYQDGNCTP